PVTLAIAQSIPEDLHAFPKYSVSYLNALPVLNTTAQRWLKDGLHGGEQEFLSPWYDDDTAPPDSGPSDEEAAVLDTRRVRTLQYMRFGPQSAYLCYIPQPPPLPPPIADDPPISAPPSKSWQQLSSLAGKCLYHRQGWFTYSYCHNSHVRQFKELPHAHPHPPGGHTPEEDPDWEAFTLGRSPTADRSDDLATNTDAALANHLELARGARQRYLVQRWGDGTTCDKTGRKREIEVQFHCSMTTTDTIMFVKETTTCNYVLVIHTPRLCNEPGFKSRLEQMEEAPIRCRQIVDDVKGVEPSLAESEHPSFQRPRQPLIALPTEPADTDEAKAASKKKDTADAAAILRKALEALLGQAADGTQ
ncbi:hypothetical protein SISSUDRAFT_968615, partial [Sistotremastrum suecicum HHB10207 ss-3]